MKRPMHPIFVILIFFGVSCQFSEQKAPTGHSVSQELTQDRLTDSCAVAGTTYRIYQRDTLAYIQASGPHDTVYGQLLLRAPVYIVRAHKSREVLTYKYPQFDSAQVVMLFGDKIATAEQTLRGVDSAHWCGSRIQGLIVRRERSTLGRQALSAMKCKGFSSDEKDFYSVAEEN